MSDRPKYPARGGDITVASAVTVLPFPPIVAGDATIWAGEKSVLPVFEIQIKAVSATDLTLAELFGGSLESSAIASDNVDTVDFANNELDIATHGLETGDGPLQITTSGTLPDGLELLTDYWVIKVDAGIVQLAASLGDALAGTAVAFSDAGSGTHTIAGASASTLEWRSYGLLGQANDGAISLVAKGGYTTRVNHSPHTDYYCVSATLSAAVATTVTLKPVQDAP